MFTLVRQLLCSAMIMKRQGTSSVSDFLELVTGQKRSHRGNFYGFTLLHPDGRRACYVGHEMESGRPEKYIYGLFPPHEGGGPPSHGSDWNVPGRLKPLWRQGFRVNTETVIYTLSGLPKCFETGITFAIEEILKWSCNNYLVDRSLKIVDHFQTIDMYGTISFFNPDFSYWSFSSSCSIFAILKI